ncbi:hypothetical protein [Paraburkholderia hospita]|uniref:Uncharacterized protein n=1 Tax=Paraburkholderia hospita TaxID=169430 RepID=A0AAN1JMA9_9BURK|nr:hypothetical protein [Paraburkholderia hospita]AUT76724.1 hypothetical protein C2L64_49060 [Paraburkholderia hospita]
MPVLLLRRYSGKGSKELFELLEKHNAEVDEWMGGTKGLVTYTLVRSGDGGFSVTVCQDKTSIEESLQRAKEWISKNAGSIGAAEPDVDGG